MQRYLCSDIVSHVLYKDGNGFGVTRRLWFQWFPIIIVGTLATPAPLFRGVGSPIRWNVIHSINLKLWPNRPPFLGQQWNCSSSEGIGWIGCLRSMRVLPQHLLKSPPSSPSLSPCIKISPSLGEKYGACVPKQL